MQSKIFLQVYRSGHIGRKIKHVLVLIQFYIPSNKCYKTRYSGDSVFLSTETHAKRLLTIWKRSVWTTLKRSFAVLANQIIVSETFQAFRILANQISVRKTLSWKPCLVANVLSFASSVNQNPADSSYLRSLFIFFSVSLNYNNYSSHGFADVTFHYITVYGSSPFKIAFS